MSFFLEVGDDIQQFTSFAATIDLTSAAVSPMGPVRGHAREIYIDSAGSATLAVKLAGSRGNTRTLTVAAGDRLQGKFLSIETTTNVTRLTVTW